MKKDGKARAGKESEKHDALKELEAELELLRKVHLRAIFEAREGVLKGIDDEALKHISSYLKVVEKLLRVISLRKKEKESDEIDRVVKVIWEVLLEVPSLHALLKDPKIQAEILKRIKDRLKNLT